MHKSKPSVLALRVLKRAALVAAKDHAGVVQPHANPREVLYRVGTTYPDTLCCQRDLT